jgi:phage terminase small subunit
MGFSSEEATDGRKKALTDKQRMFIAHYTNPEADTYLNATETAKKVCTGDPENIEKHANLYGYRIKHHPKVQNAIQEILEGSSFGMERRLQVLAEIGNGTSITEKEVVTKHGEVVTIQVRPSMRERLQAVDLANKVDGTYTQQKIDMEVAKDEAAKLHNKILRDVTGS